jgi:hypothetical protein
MPLLAEGGYHIVNWLQHFLDQSVHQNLCTNPGCTTCGARQFRDGLFAELESHTNISTSTNTTAHAFAEVARMLADVRPDDGTAPRVQAKFEEAVRLIFTDAWSILGEDAADRIATPLLGGCWTGDLLARMKLHHGKRLRNLRQQADNANPERVKERREAKRQLRQKQHVERLERKRARDRDRSRDHRDLR